MNRRDFVQGYLLKHLPIKSHGDWEQYMEQVGAIVDAANRSYDFIEKDPQVREDNSMADTRPYLDALNGANQ